MYYLGTPFGAGLSQAVLSTEKQSRPTVFLYYGGGYGYSEAGSAHLPKAAPHQEYGAVLRGGKAGGADLG